MHRGAQRSATPEAAKARNDGASWTSATRARSSSSSRNDQLVFYKHLDIGLEGHQ